MKYFSILFIGLCLSACKSLPDLNAREPSHFIAHINNPELETFLQLPPESDYRQPEESLPEESTPSENDFTDFASPIATQTLPKSTPQPAKAHTNRHLTDVYILDNATDAFAARIALIDKANTTLDAQYYIWRNDISGSILFKKLWNAAERGVRVRLLMDDNNTHGLDSVLGALNAHPNIQIRLFNPFLYRRWRFLGYLSDFPRLNRRMHNKSLTADNRVAIVGGRNIGDEYFDVYADKAFADMDVLASGTIVSHISADFDRYWQSESAYPFESIVQNPNIHEGVAQLFRHGDLEPAYADYRVRLAQSPFSPSFHTPNIAYIRAQTQLISDDPAKALDKKTTVNISDALTQTLHIPRHEMYLVSPYFVPSKTGVHVLADLVQQGVNITILTNSLRATDVAAVHSGYARYRKPLLKSGIHLYEFKEDNYFLTGKDKGLTGSTATSLHAKTFVIDRERIFIGSFNLDPRSAKLNTEMGLVIHQAQLARQMQHNLHHFTLKTAYHVRLNEQNHLQWHNPDTGKVSNKEPEATFWKRVISKILSYLPIERLL